MSDGQIELAAALVKLNDTVTRLERSMKPTLGQRFLYGIATGFGTLVGATLVTALLIWMAQPLKRLSSLEPTIDRLSRALEQKR